MTQPRLGTNRVDWPKMGFCSMLWETSGKALAGSGG